MVSPRERLASLLEAAELWERLLALKALGDTADVRRRVLAHLARARVLASEARSRHKDLSDLPPALRYLIEALVQEIQNVTGDLASGAATLAQWQSNMIDLLATFYPAAQMAGLDTGDLTDDQITGLVDQVSAQADFLADFAIEIQSADTFWQGWNARAESYAGGIKNPYWQGATDMLPLPAMPGDGTSQCLGYCNCGWRIVPLDENAGDFDCYWELESGAAHCQTCTERARQWNPLQIRGFRLQ